MSRRPESRARAPTLSAAYAPVLVAAFVVLFDNLALWRALAAVNAGVALPVLIGVVALAFTALVTLLLQVVNLPWLFRPSAIALLLFSALCAYSLGNLGVVIDADMARNLFETDAGEVRGYFGAALLLHLGLLWLLPTALLLWLRVDHAPFARTWGKGALVALALLAVAIGGIAVLYKPLALVSREHRALRMSVVPTYPLYAVGKYLRERHAEPDAPPAAMATDATRVTAGGPAAAGPATASERPLVFVLVLGETARASAFSLNGYARPTNPQLARRPVLSYADVTACGTSTATALPCMFAFGGRAASESGRARREENVLDVLQRLRVDVRWLDNNSGCKGVCDRIPFERPGRAPGAAPCTTRECYDEVLVYATARLLDDAALRHDTALRAADATRDRLLVLHTHGSHGPDYANRVPARFKRFLPECPDADVAACSRERIVNAYDNTILYTDHVLAALIDALAARADRFDTVLLYVSDHGESLGENGIYLHGFPYALAPREQVHVPMLLWASEGFYARARIDRACLARGVAQPRTHDVLVHTALGAFGVRTREYLRGEDLLAACRRG